MKIINDTLNFSIPEMSAITLGKFDGIHKGHQKLMKMILAKKEQGLKSVVFTFGQMPGIFFFGKGRTILTRKERQLHLERMGIDYMIECPFVPEVIQMEPEKFIEDVLVNQLHVKYIAVGPDFRFGHNRKGSVGVLKKMASVYGYEVEVFDKECLDDKVISSTYVRHMLEIGEMETVQKLLGYPYYVSGTVVHGHAIGRKIGIPTINLIPDDDKMLPPNGVYLTKTIWEEKQIFGITNVGYKPTISGEEAKGIETHLYDFDGDLYDKELTVEFYAYHRPERRFESLEDLKSQLAKDTVWGREIIVEKNLVS